MLGALAHGRRFSQDHRQSLRRGSTSELRREQSLRDRPVASHRCRRAARRGRRGSVEAAAVSAFGPAFVILPFCLLALFLVWLLVRLVWDVPFWLFAVGYCVAAVLLFVRPIQAVVLTPLFGARKPTRRRAARHRRRCGASLAQDERPAAGPLHAARPPARRAQRLRLRRPPRRRHDVRHRGAARARARRSARPRAQPPPRHAHRRPDDPPLAVAAGRRARPHRVLAGERRHRGDERVRVQLAGR